LSAAGSEGDDEGSDSSEDSDFEVQAEEDTDIEDGEVEEVTATMKKASVASKTAAASAGGKKKTPTLVKKDPTPKKEKAVEKDLRDEIPWENRFYCDFTQATHARMVYGVNTEMVTVKFFTAGGLPSDYKPIIHPSGQYLDLQQKQPEWHRDPGMLKKGYMMAWQSTVDRGVRVAPMNVDKIQAFRDAGQLETNNYPDGVVTKTMRIKLTTPVKTDHGFATCEGPEDYPGYSFEIQVDDHDTRTCVFTVDLWSARPPAIKKAAEPFFYYSDTNSNDVDDEDHDVRPRRTRFPNPQPPPNPPQQNNNTNNNGMDQDM
jgi:hypothetical protein